MLAVAVTTRDNASVIRARSAKLQFVAAQAWRDITREHRRIRGILYAMARKK
jgi:hypothetical protein